MQASARLSRVFRDAFDVCRALNIEYLWVDSLCILQDDPADFEREATQMVGMNNSLATNARRAMFPTLLIRTRMFHWR
jgi:hypothetical protein